MNPPVCTGYDSSLGMSRRGFLDSFGLGLGGVALADLLGGAEARAALPGAGGSLAGTHLAPKAKRVIYLFQSGGPSQIDLLDYKPLLNEKHGEQLPAEVRGEQRLTGMSGNQSSLPLVGSPFKFAQHGQSGHWMSDLLPHTAKIADELCVVKSMYTEAINHGPVSPSCRPDRSSPVDRASGPGSTTGSGPKTRTCHRSWCW